VSGRCLAVVVLGLSTLAACVAALPHPAEADVSRARSGGDASITLADLEAGRAAYVERCGSCHLLFLPADQRASRWPAHVDRMAERAKLKPEQRRVIESFLVTMAQRPE